MSSLKKQIILLVLLDYRQLKMQKNKILTQRCPPRVCSLASKTSMAGQQSRLGKLTCIKCYLLGNYLYSTKQK